MPRKSAKPPPERVRILLAEDHIIVREGLRALLAEVPAFEVVGQASDGEEALTLATRLTPDVAVLDVALPGIDGIELTRRIRAEVPGCRVLILSMHGDEEVVSAAFAEGATGYVVKDEAGRELIDAIQQVADGGLHVSPRATEALVQSARARVSGMAGAGTATSGRQRSFGSTSSPDLPALGGGAGRGAGGAGPSPSGSSPELPTVGPAAPPRSRREAPLSPRESEVLKLVAAGMSTKQVAYQLSISPKTADAHRQAIMRKLDIHDVAGLVKYALREGYIDLA